MFSKEYKANIRIGRGTKDFPEFIDGVTVQCKNCIWWSQSKHCGVQHSERLDGESWCSTTCPKQFFKKRRQTND